MMGFLARWARRMSWRETARAFQTSWEAVYRWVEWFVQWGLDEVSWRGPFSRSRDRCTMPSWTFPSFNSVSAKAFRASGLSGLSLSRETRRLLASSRNFGFVAEARS